MKRILCTSKTGLAYQLFLSTLTTVVANRNKKLPQLNICYTNVQIKEFLIEYLEV